MSISDTRDLWPIIGIFLYLEESFLSQDLATSTFPRQTTNNMQSSNLVLIDLYIIVYSH